MPDKGKDKDDEPRIELHARTCSCGGGAWMIHGGASSAPCSQEGSHGGVVLPLSDWRDTGKPRCVEEYAEASSRREAGDRREFTRFSAALEVRLSRIRTWKEVAPQAEDTVTEVIAQGGALVRSRMAVEEGEILNLEVVPFYKTRAQVLYLNPARGDDGKPYLRIGVRFLDEPMPANLIPFDAEPLE